MDKDLVIRLISEATPDMPPERRSIELSVSTAPTLDITIVDAFTPPPALIAGVRARLTEILSNVSTSLIPDACFQEMELFLEDILSEALRSCRDSIAVSILATHIDFRHRLVQACREAQRMQQGLET